MHRCASVDFSGFCLFCFALRREVNYLRVTVSEDRDKDRCFLYAKHAGDLLFKKLYSPPTFAKASEMQHIPMKLCLILLKLLPYEKEIKPL